MHFATSFADLGELGAQLGMESPEAFQGIGTISRASETREDHRQWLRTRRSEKQLLREIGRAMASKASPKVVEMAGLTPLQRVLDSTSTNGGNILVRVDIEDLIAALFVQRFPWWDRLNDGPANGLKHTYNTVTAAGAQSDSAMTLATETTAASDDTSTFVQGQTTNIATFLQRRGVSFKERAAVAQSGMAYNPETQEIEDGLTYMRARIQKELFQGNFAVSSGAGATTELGANNTNGFDGLRIVTGGLGTFNASAVRVDADLRGGSIAQAINTAAARIENNGGMASAVVLSSTAKAAIMDEQEGKQRAVEKIEIIPGVSVSSVNTTSGPLPLIGVPGTNAIGHYTRTGDGKDVEDIYVLDESMLYRRWIYSRDITVLEIPAGVAGALTQTYLIFHFCGLQVRDGGLFQGKVRIPQTLS